MPHECKLIIFDLDGVLLDAKEIHFRALNMALNEVDQKFVISKQDHVKYFDGLPTLKKLERLVETKEFPRGAVEATSLKKQEHTENLIREINENVQLQVILLRLKDDGYKLAVCSNSLHITTVMGLERLGILHFFDAIFGNDDVKQPKPNPEMFLTCMAYFSVAPNETLILEDSKVGRQAVNLSGAHLCPIGCPDDVKYEMVKQYAGFISPKRGKWKADRLNVLIPMAGEGSRFRDVGYSFPKPLIEVNGKPMIQLVVENLAIDAQYIFIVKQEHYFDYNLKYLLNNIAPNCKIVTLSYKTEGAALTTLHAMEHIDNSNHLLIANSDQFLEWDSADFMYYIASRPELDGVIPVFEASHPKWSYVRLNDDGYVVEVAEKKPISNLATAGIYYWRSGSQYVSAVNSMLDADIRTNGEFYIAPAYNEIVKNKIPMYGVKNCVGIYKFEKMWGLGTPEDLEAYVNGYTE